MLKIFKKLVNNNNNEFQNLGTIKAEKVLREKFHIDSDEAAEVLGGALERKSATYNNVMVTANFYPETILFDIKRTK